MKKIFTIILIGLLTSCGNDEDISSKISQEAIIGSWNAKNYSGYQIGKFRTELHYYTGEIEISNDFMPEINEEWNESLEYGSNILIFKEDQLMEARGGDLNYTGYNRYILDVKNNRFLLYHPKNSDPDIYDIEEYNQNKLIISKTINDVDSLIEPRENSQGEYYADYVKIIEFKYYDKVEFEKID